MFSFWERRTQKAIWFDGQLTSVQSRWAHHHYSRIGICISLGRVSFLWLDLEEVPLFSFVDGSVCSPPWEAYGIVHSTDFARYAPLLLLLSVGIG